jgi:hypothetical protein
MMSGVSATATDHRTNALVSALPKHPVAAVQASIREAFYTIALKRIIKAPNQIGWLASARRFHVRLLTAVANSWLGLGSSSFP